MDTTNVIEVHEPRWNDRMVLCATWKVVEGLNRIVMPKAKNYIPYYMTGAQIRQYPIEKHISKQGNTFTVYAIPLDELKEHQNPTPKLRIGITEPEIKEIKQIGLL